MTTKRERPKDTTGDLRGPVSQHETQCSWQYDVTAISNAEAHEREKEGSEYSQTIRESGRMGNALLKA